MTFKIVMPEDQKRGTLDILLRYDPPKETLLCKIERARNLQPMDINGLADPFCKLNILPIGSNNQTITPLRTKTVHKTLDPEFNEKLYFYGITKDDINSEKALHILILQDDVAGRDFLGEAKFPLQDLPLYQTKYYTVFLQNQDQIPLDQQKITWGEDIMNNRGLIYLSLCYDKNKCALLVNIEKATNLLSMDSNGLSDPFVKLRLIQDTQLINVEKRKSKFKKWIPLKNSKKNSAIQLTKVQKKTLNPEWNEEFSFEASPTDLTTLALVITVWDKDYGKRDDFLGSMILSCSSKGARLHHWKTTIHYPNEYHHGCHQLTENMLFYE